MPFRKELPVPSGADRFSLIERRFLRTLLIGFGLVLVAMIGSGWIGLSTMRRIGAETETMSDQYLRETSLIDRMLRHQGDLGVLLYSMAERKTGAGLETLRPLFRAQHQLILRNVRDALERTPHAAEAGAWRDVEQTAAKLYLENSSYPDLTASLRLFSIWSARRSTIILAAEAWVAASRTSFSRLLDSKVSASDS